MNTAELGHHPFSGMHRWLASLAAVLVSVTAHGAPIDDRVALGAAYIPALAMSTAAAQAAAFAPKSRASLGVPHSQWPVLGQNLGCEPP
jgi:hypothetical protein